MSDGLLIPGDLDAAAQSAARLRGLALALRVATSRQVGQLRALEGWTGTAHRQWIAAAERTCRAAVGLAAMVDEAVRVLDWFCRSAAELRARAASLAARALVASLEIGPDGEVRPVGPPLPATAVSRGLGQPVPPAVGELDAGHRWVAEVAGHRLAAQVDPWRAVQLEVAALVEDAQTVYAATVRGLRGVADRYARAAVAPPDRHAPDGGGFPLGPVGTAVSLAQLPGALDDLRSLRRGADPVRLSAMRSRAEAVPEAVQAVVRARRLGRAARLAAAARTLDRLVAAAGRVPVVPAAASYPVGRLLAARSTAAITRIPVVNVVLAGCAVRDDVATGGYSLPAAVGREGAVVVAGYGAGEGAAYLLVSLGGAPVAAALVAIGVGMIVSELVGRLYDRASGHA